MENWRVIGEFPNYEVSDKGSIRSIKSGRNLKGGFDRNGYACVNLRREGKTYFKPIHRLVAISFLEAVEGKACVNHIDLDKSNNTLQNLEFCNHYENNTHQKKHRECTSTYAGVGFDKARNKWRAFIKVAGKHYFLGRFDTEIEAYEAYLRALDRHNISNKYA